MKNGIQHRGTEDTEKNETRMVWKGFNTETQRTQRGSNHRLTQMGWRGLKHGGPAIGGSSLRYDAEDHGAERAPIPGCQRSAVAARAFFFPSMSKTRGGGP